MAISLSTHGNIIQGRMNPRGYRVVSDEKQIRKNQKILLFGFVGVLYVYWSLWILGCWVLDEREGLLLLLLWQDVQLVQVGLDVAVRDLLALLNAQDLAHGSIRMNRVTLVGILQLVLVHVG